MTHCIMLKNTNVNYIALDIIEKCTEKFPRFPELKILLTF